MFRLGGVAIALAAFVTACAPADGAPSQEDLNAVRTVLDQELAAANAGDPAAFNAILADDVVVVPPNAPALEGDAAREWVRGFMDQVTVAVEPYDSDQVEIVGDVAIHTYSFSWSITPKAGGDAFSERGRGVHILRRQPDGSWNIAYDIWNADMPTPSM